MIRAIDSVSVSKICSGQVIVDLATAVKECLENALDANATSIQITLKDMGIDHIEVSDNGSGIHPEDYESICLKHHTSKLKQFHDLDSISSFGFRGEALNALCELSEQCTITTRCASDEIGMQLFFSPQGEFLEKKMFPRGQGTTVAISKLFSSLPVRRGEFIRSIKKHYQRFLRIVQCYAIIAVGVKFLVYNISKVRFPSVIFPDALQNVVIKKLDS